MLLRNEYDEKISASLIPILLLNTARLAAWKCARDRGMPLLYSSQKGGVSTPLATSAQLSQTHPPTSVPAGPYRGHAHL